MLCGSHQFIYLSYFIPRRSLRKKKERKKEETTTKKTTKNKKQTNKKQQTKKQKKQTPNNNNQKRCLDYIATPQKVGYNICTEKLHYSLIALIIYRRKRGYNICDIEVPILLNCFIIYRPQNRNATLLNGKRNGLIHYDKKLVCCGKRACLRNI